MSVSYLTASELGVFAGIAVKLKLQTLAEACEMCAALSESNCAALFTQYGDIQTANSADEIEAEALRALASPTGLQAHWGPVVYNCIDNEGGLHVGQMRIDSAESAPEAITATVDDWKRIEDACRKYHDDEAARLKRQAEDDEAYTEVGPLPVLSLEEFREEMTRRGATRLIVAQFNVNESDSYTDYYGGRSARRVVIGFGTGSRESFVQMRKAAALFPPTADYAPGCDEWTVNAPRSAPDQHGYAERVPLRDDQGDRMTFSTKEAAEKYVAGLLASAPDQRAGYCGALDFLVYAREHGADYRCESLEHRENYSMGGGNYLGRGRYSGWKVYQTTQVSAGEFFDAPQVKKPRTAARVTAAPTPTIADQYAANV